MPRNWSICILLGVLSGCRSTPGFKIGAELSIPPTISNVDTLHPTPTAPTTTYLMEAPAQTPVIRRQYIVPQPPTEYVPIPSNRMPRAPEQVPMPKDAPKNPCQPTCALVDVE